VKKRRRPKAYKLAEVAKIIAASSGESRLFYWLLAECGVRAGELAGVRLNDIDGAKLTITQSVWNGDLQAPKTENSEGREIGLSPQLVALVWEQIAKQREKGYEFLFTSSSGKPLDMNNYRQRKLRTSWKALEIQEETGKAFHAFRHFNAGLLDALCIPLKVRKERLGHAFSGDFTLDVYGEKPDWNANLDAAAKLGAAIEETVREAEQAAEQKLQEAAQQQAEAENSVSLIAVNENGLQESPL
jgi:integrase